jgi:Chaperone of endosialidase
MNRFALSLASLTVVLSAAPHARAISCGESTACSWPSTAALSVSNDKWSAISGSTTTANPGIYAKNTSSTAGAGEGIRGDSSLGVGVHGVSSGDGYTGAGVLGNGLTGATGVYGRSVNGFGIIGVSDNAVGIKGQAIGSSFAVQGFLTGTTGTGAAIYGSSNAISTAFAGYFQGNLKYTGQLIGPNSDARLKKNINSIQGALEQVLSLHGVTFEWKDPAAHTGAGTHWGFIAQDVEKTFPSWVTADQDGFKIIDTSGFDSVMVESIKTLNTKLTASVSENHALQAKVSKLEARLDALEGKRKPTAAAMGFDTSSPGFFALGIGVAALAMSRRKRGDKEAT